MKIINKRLMTAFITMILLSAMLLNSNISLDTYAKTTIMLEDFNSNWQDNGALISKTDNLLQGSLDTNPGVLVISPSDGNEAYLVYKFEANDGKKFAAVNIAFKGRANVGCFVNLYASTNNTDYKFIDGMSSQNATDKDAVLGTRATDLSAVADGAGTVYLKIVFKTDVSNLTWACLDYLKVYSEEVDSASAIPSKPVGEILNESYDDNTWTNNGNILTSYNLTRGTVNSNGCLYQTASDNYGYIVYKVITDTNMRNISIDFSGRSINTASSEPAAYFGQSHIEFQIFTDNGWVTVYDHKGWGTTGKDSANITLPKNATETDTVYGKKIIYLMVKLRSSGSTGNWAALNSLKITAAGEKTVVAGINGHIINQSFNDASYVDNAFFKDSRNVKISTVSGVNTLTVADDVAKKTGYLLYQIKTDKPMATMGVYLKGKLSGTSSIRVLLSKEEAGVYKEVYKAAPAGEVQELDFLNTELPIILNNEIYDTSEVFLKIEITTDSTLDRACLSSLRVETTKVLSIPITPNGILMTEEFTDNSFEVHDNLVSSTNAKVDVLDSNNQSIKVLRPSQLGSPAEVVYQVKTDLEMNTLTVEIKGRVISTTAGNYSSIEVLVSNDGQNFTSAEIIKNDSLAGAYSFFQSPRQIKLDSYVKDKTSLYVKFVVISAGSAEGTATWGCIDSLKLVSTKGINIPVSPNGIIINESFDNSAWNSVNNNLIEVENLSAGVEIDTNNKNTKVIVPADLSKSGYMVFQVKTDKPMGKMIFEYTGRVISNNASKESSVKFYISDNGTDWRSVGGEKGNSLDASNNFSPVPRSKNISEEAYNKTMLYIKVEIFSVNLTWGCLNSFKVTTGAMGENSFTGFIPEPKANGELFNEDYTKSANFRDRVYNSDNVFQSVLSNTDSRKVVYPASGAVRPAGGFITYAFATSAPIGPATVQFTGRAIRGSSLEFLVSNDGVNWESAYYIYSPDGGNDLDYYGSVDMGRNFDITDYVKNSQFFYLRVRIESNTESWGCLKSLKVVTQNVPPQISASKAVENGVLLENDFEGKTNNWQEQALEVSNIIREMLDKKNPSNAAMFLYPSNISVPSYIIYGYRTTTPVGELSLEYTGRAIIGSAIRVFVSNDRMSWTKASELMSPQTGSDRFLYGDASKKYTVDLTDYVKNTQLFYIKIELQSGFESWAALGSIKLNSFAASAGPSKGTSTINDGESYYDPNYNYDAADGEEESSSNSSNIDNPPAKTPAKTPVKPPEKSDSIFLYVIIGAGSLIIIGGIATFIILKQKNIIFKKK